MTETVTCERCKIGFNTRQQDYDLKGCRIATLCRRCHDAYVVWLLKNRSYIAFTEVRIKRDMIIYMTQRDGLDRSEEWVALDAKEREYTLALIAETDAFVDQAPRSKYRHTDQIPIIDQ